MYNLLIVDDDKVQRKLITHFIKNSKLKFNICQEAVNGKEALKLIPKFAFDAIISDIKMPIINGMELLKEIRENLELDIPVVLVSTYNDFEFARQGIVYKAFDYILKPFNRDSIKKVLLKLQEELELKESEAQKKEHLDEHLNQSLENIFTNDDEKRLYNIIIYENQTIDKYVDDLFIKLLSFFDNKPFNIGLILDNIQKNMINKIVSKYKFIEVFDAFDFSKYTPLQQLKNTNEISDNFKNNLNELAKTVDYLHLNHKDNIVIKMCDYAMYNIDKHIKIDDISYKLNYSADHLLKLFKQKTGTSYSKYSKIIKMEKAKNMLKIGLYKNYEICEAIGYKDYNHFSKIFKKQFGYSPSEYRKLILLK